MEHLRQPMMSNMSLPLGLAGLRVASDSLVVFSHLRILVASAGFIAEGRGILRPLMEIFR
jgi:hypothetical protein